MNKDTVYIDIDDEITSIIEKVSSSKEKIVALVLPKRATMLQSIVNMKLLKRAADDTKKRVVLVTSENNLLPLAGAVGLYVAPTLQSKPAIPAPPDVPDETEAQVDLPADEPRDIDPNKSVGELAGVKASDETIEVDDSPVKPAAATGAAKAVKPKGNKKLRVPNFNRFRTRFILAGVALLALIIGFVIANSVLPKAKLTIQTDTSEINKGIDFTASTTAKELDTEDLIIPAKLEELKKTDTEKAAATGQKDMGTRATGTVTLKNCTKSDGAISIPAGTGVSSNNLTFITQQTVNVPASAFSGGGTCISSTQDVAVTAQNPGEQYNLSSGRSFSVSGYSTISGSNGSAFSGGTTRVVKVVSAQDVENAKKKLSERSNSSSEDELKKKLQEQDMYALEETLNSGEPTITSSPKAGEEGNEVTVTSIATSTMMGIKQDDLEKLLDEKTKEDIEEGKEKILNYGIDKAEFTITDKKNPANLKIAMRTAVQVGSEINQDELKREIAGKKKGEVTNLIKERPGVKEVNVSYSPFWVAKAPKNPTKITITIEGSSDNDGGR